MIKSLVKRFVLATSEGPLRHLYFGVYRFLIDAGALLLRSYPGVKAVYLRRGCAKGEITPGVSDIDYAVVTDRMDDAQEADMRREYERFARLTLLPDTWLNIHEASKIRSGDHSAYERYYFQEGKATWKLLYGFDYLSQLPEAPLASLYGGLCFEFTYWWRKFSREFLLSARYWEDRAFRNSFCYKAVAEVLKAGQALWYGRLSFHRTEIDGCATAHLPKEERDLACQVLAATGGSFLSDDRRIIGRTASFLFAFLDRVHAELGSHPYVKIRKDVSVRVDFKREESAWSREDEAQAGAWLRALEDGCDGAYLVSSWLLPVGEMALLLKVDPGRAPTAERLAGMRWNQARFHVHLLFPHAALEIGRRIASPLNSPDMYLLLGQPACWTSVVEDGLRDARIDICDRLGGASGYRSTPQRFLGDFWKALQLALIQRSWRGGEPLFPLTVPAIRRALEDGGAPLPPGMDDLAEAYRASQSGERFDIGAIFPAALAYLHAALESARAAEETSR